MTEIPDRIREKISLRPGADYQDEAIIEYFLQSDEPYHSRKQIQNEFDWSKQNANDRLQELVELRILAEDTIANGKIYWINREVSNWPIPPDVEVEPVDQRANWFDELSRFNKFLAALGVFGIVLGGLLIAVAPFLAISGIFELIGIDNAGGLLFVVGWVAITLGFVFSLPPLIRITQSFHGRRTTEES